MTAIVLSQYVTWTPVGVEEIRGVQGRYFIGLFLLIPLVMNSTSLFLKTYDQKLLEYEAGLVLMNKEEKIAETKNLKIVNASQNVWLVAINSLFVLGMILLTLSVYYKG